MLSPLASAVLRLALLQAALPTQAARAAVPRISLAHGDPSRPVSSFSQEGAQNYSTLLLAPDGETLFVGARDALFSLNVTAKGQMSLVKELRWRASEQKVQECSFKGKSKEKDCFNFVRILVPVNETHLYACGTYAYSPTCTYIDATGFALHLGRDAEPLTEDGKGRCPYDPALRYSALMVGGDLYTGTTTNFQGSESTISRSLGVRVPLKTETSLKWLQDPVFVGSAFAPQGTPGQHKVYFFFTETATRFDPLDRTTVTRIARVCKSDEGGARVLQKRWTTFLKARMLCFLPEDRFPFNLLQDVVLAEPLDQEQAEPVLYGVFGSQWHRGGSVSSAVCAFSLREAERVFDGRYRELNRETQSWSTYTGTVTQPRPGSCHSSTGWAADTTLNFLKDHFLMEGALRPLGDGPLLLGTHHRYLRLAVGTALSPSGSSQTVLFLSTETGLLHKTVIVNGEAFIIEELQLFPNPQPIHHLLLIPNKAVVYVSSPGQVLEVPVCNCGAHNSCGSCVLSRDPYCAWDPGARVCRPTAEAPPGNRWIQDVERADAINLCGRAARPRARDFAPRPPRDSAPETRVVERSSLVRLPCAVRSRLVRRIWLHEGAEVATDGARYAAVPEGLLFAAEPAAAGRWECWASERGYRSLVVRYQLRLAEPDGWSRESAILRHGERANAGKTYWDELVMVSVLFALCGAGALVWAAYRVRPRSTGKIQQAGSGRAGKTQPDSPPPRGARDAGEGEPPAERRGAGGSARRIPGHGGRGSDDLGPSIPGQASACPAIASPTRS